MDKYYHLFSSPLSGPLFVNDDDRRYFLNRIALCHISKIFKTYVYCIMNNHIHLLVSGDEDRIKEAFNDIKRLYHRYLNSREEAIKVKLEEFSVSTRLINNPEDFKIVVAYILRNPFIAGIDCPSNYKWCSSFLYFNAWLSRFKGESAKEYGKRNVRNIIGTRIDVGESCSFLDGILNPVFWCDYKRVEQVFGRSGDFFKLLGKWEVESNEEAKMKEAEKNSISDTELIGKIKNYCSLYGVEKVEELSIQEMQGLIKTSHRRWGASKKQLERTLGVSPALITKNY